MRYQLQFRCHLQRKAAALLAVAKLRAAPVAEVVARGRLRLNSQRVAVPVGARAAARHRSEPLVVRLDRHNVAHTLKLGRNLKVVKYGEGALGSRASVAPAHELVSGHRLRLEGRLVAVGHGAVYDNPAAVVAARANLVRNSGRGLYLGLNLDVLIRLGGVLPHQSEADGLAGGLQRPDVYLCVALGHKNRHGGVFLALGHVAVGVDEQHRVPPRVGGCDFGQRAFRVDAEQGVPLAVRLPAVYERLVRRAAHRVGAVHYPGYHRHLGLYGVNADGVGLDFLGHLAHHHHLGAHLHVAAAHGEQALRLLHHRLRRRCGVAGLRLNCRCVGLLCVIGSVVHRELVGGDFNTATAADIEKVGVILARRAACYHKAAAFGLAGLVLVHIHAGVAARNGEQRVLLGLARRAPCHNKAAASGLVFGVGAVNIDLRAAAVNDQIAVGVTALGGRAARNHKAAPFGLV